MTSLLHILQPMLVVGLLIGAGWFDSLIGYGTCIVLPTAAFGLKCYDCDLTASSCGNQTDCGTDADFETTVCHKTGHDTTHSTFRLNSVVVNVSAFSVAHDRVRVRLLHVGQRDGDHGRVYGGRRTDPMLL